LAGWGVLSSCAVKYPVLGRFDNSDEIFRGRIISRTLTGQGSMEMKGSTTETKCVGRRNLRFAPPGEEGRIILDCQDGRKIAVNYKVTGWGKGFGAGKDQKGNRFTFTFGMTASEAEERVRSLRQE